MKNNEVDSYVYKSIIDEKYIKIYLTIEEIEKSNAQNINPIVTLMAKHNAIKQGKIFNIESINLKYINSFEFEKSIEGIEFWADISSKFKESYFNIGKSYFILQNKIIRVKKIIIENIKNKTYTIWIKFDNGTVLNSNQLDKFLETINKWYKDDIIHNSNHRIYPEVYEKLYAYPISVIRHFLNFLWLNSSDKRDFFNIFILNNPMEILVKRFCYDKSWFTNVLLYHDYAEYYKKVGENVLKEDLEYLKDILTYNSEYELPEYFKSKCIYNNKTEKELGEEKLKTIEEFNAPKCIKGIEYRLIYPINKLEVSLTEVEKILCIENNINPYVALLYKANYYHYKLLWSSDYIVKKVTEILNIKNSFEKEYFWKKVIKNRGVLGESRSITYSLGKDNFKLHDITFYVTDRIILGNFSIHYKYIGDTNEYYLIENYKDFKKEDFNVINKINSKEDGRQEFKSRENGKCKDQLQRENTAKSCCRFTKRSELFGGRYQPSITSESTFSKKRTSKNKSILRNN